MVALDFLKGIANKVARKIDKLEEIDFDATKSSYEREAKRYGFTASFLDDNTICVRNKGGKELVAQYPRRTTSMNHYERFVLQMQNSQLPLPPINAIQVIVGTSSFMPTDTLHKGDVMRSDIPKAQDSSVTKIAKKMSIDVNETRSMIDFARFKLYERFKERLRDKKPTSET